MRPLKKRNLNSNIIRDFLIHAAFRINIYNNNFPMHPVYPSLVASTTIIIIRKIPIVPNNRIHFFYGKKLHQYS